MPILTGIQLLSRVRADSRLARLPVLVVSARSPAELAAAVEGDAHAAIINKNEFSPDLYRKTLEALRPVGTVP